MPYINHVAVPVDDVDRAVDFYQDWFSAKVVPSPRFPVPVAWLLLGKVQVHLVQHPDRASVAVTGEAGLGYMLGNLEVLLREKLGITVVHISNGGFAGYGPGFWGPGHDPFTHQVMGYDEVDMSKVIGALGFHTERVSEPAEVIPALRRALEVNTSGRPAYIEFICCQYPVYGGWVGRSAE